MCHTNKNKIKLTTKEHDSSRLMVSTSQISGLVTTPVKNKIQPIKQPLLTLRGTQNPQYSH